MLCHVFWSQVEYKIVCFICIRNAFIDIMTYAKFNFNQLILTLIFGIRAWRTTEKAAPDRVNSSIDCCCGFAYWFDGLLL